MRGTKTVYVESLSVTVKITFGAFSSQCWAPLIYFSFWRHTSLCGGPDLHLIPTFGAFFIMRGAQRAENRKSWFYIDGLKL